MSTVIGSDLSRLQNGTHHDPFYLLGWHPLSKGWVLRVFMPDAEQVRLQGISFYRIEGTDCFELILDGIAYDLYKDDFEQHPLLDWQDKVSGKWLNTRSPYTFLPVLTAFDLHLLGEGKHYQSWKLLGSRLREMDGIQGCFFAVWAPNVKRVSVVGEFNRWNGLSHPMRSHGDSGVWELFIPSLQAGEAYKYEILTRYDQVILKTDPYARQMFLRPDTNACIADDKHQYPWCDQQWLTKRATFDWQHEAISIYEVHPASWRRHLDNGFYDWQELIDTLLPYVKELGYTHIELLPVSEHPLDQSWGYQVSGYYAPTARLGSPDDFRAFVDQCHQQGIGVFLDWVPGHFPKDDWGLARFTGEALYEYADQRKGEHQEWGTLVFDYSRNEVRNFLLSNALYWIEEFHIDGLRVDAVASMLYLDYARQAGQWLPNRYGGRENLEAVTFLRELNSVIHAKHPGILTMAEESTSWPAVSRPVDIGGLGFSMKWNMGWMNDNLAYIKQDPVYRKYHHNQLTFSQMYAYSENFILPLSHDEVVHMKNSMLGKMPGDYWQKFANLRLFYAWQYAHPGKKLLFMGGEFGQWLEWCETIELDWDLLNFPAHESLRRLVRDLNGLYQNYPALHRFDFEPQGFQWIDCNDSQQSILTLMRLSATPSEAIIVVLNFTPVTRSHYRIGVPRRGKYLELLNTDSNYYGGSNCGNAGELMTQQVSWMGFGQSLELTIPPLGAIFLQAAPIALSPLDEKSESLNSSTIHRI